VKDGHLGCRRHRDHRNYSVEKGLVMARGEGDFTILKGPKQDNL
jgi:hypothetical protein